MAQGGPAVVVVESGGLPVTQVTGGGNAAPFTVVTSNGFPVTLVDTLGIAVALYNLDGTAYTALSLTAPVLTLLTGASDNTPLWSFDLVSPLENDVIRIEWDDAIPYVAQVSFSDYTITAGDLSGDFEFDFGLSAFADGPWSWRSYHIRGASSSSVSNEVSETIATADVTAPTLSSPVDAKTNDTTGTGSVSTNEGNGTLYFVVSTSATPPSAAQVKAGQMHTGAAAADSGSQAVSGTGVQTITGGFTGLTASTAYTAHYMHEDAATNQSSVSTADGFTTDAAPFTPADLFTGGFGGAWYDFSDTSKGFSDAGVTPIVNAATVQQWNDSSGNGNTLSQATSGSRPAWATAGYTTYDGTADHLFRSASLDLFNAAAGVSVFALIKANPATSALLFADGSSADNDPCWTLLAADSAVASTHAGFIRNDAAGIMLASSTDLQTGVFDNTKRRIGATINTAQTSVTPYLAGTAGTPVSTLGHSGVSTTDRFAVGCWVRLSGAVSFANIPELYQLIIVKKVLSAGEITSLDTWLQTK